MRQTTYPEQPAIKRYRKEYRSRLSFTSNVAYLIIESPHGEPFMEVKPTHSRGHYLHAEVILMMTAAAHNSPNSDQAKAELPGLLTEIEETERKITKEIQQQYEQKNKELDKDTQEKELEQEMEKNHSALLKRQRDLLAHYPQNKKSTFYSEREPCRNCLRKQQQYCGNSFDSVRNNFIEYIGDRKTVAGRLKKAYKKSIKVIRSEGKDAKKSASKKRNVQSIKLTSRSSSSSSSVTTSASSNVKNTRKSPSTAQPSTNITTFNRAITHPIIEETKEDIDDPIFKGMMDFFASGSDEKLPTQIEKMGSDNEISDNEEKKIPKNKNNRKANIKEKEKKQRLTEKLTRRYHFLIKYEAYLFYLIQFPTKESHARTQLSIVEKEIKETREQLGNSLPFSNPHLPRENNPNEILNAHFEFFTTYKQNEIGGRTIREIEEENISYLESKKHSIITTANEEKNFLDTLLRDLPTGKSPVNTVDLTKDNISRETEMQSNPPRLLQKHSIFSSKFKLKKEATKLTLMKRKNIPLKKKN